MLQTKLIVQNLKCGGCANTISKHLNTLENISKVTVEPDDSSVSFKYTDESELLLAKDKLKQIGYPTVGDANSYFSKAKSFMSCATGKMNQ